ncbi:uncharacterized protein LOC118437110 [Folsomia candida]|uniref:uncharacterized protein LOC118437110 n=1 Tax=Folsomia candida TaxID=158441 RepID=UPI001605520F|nr:uncharacterized protein LOC118437110 [Folsomia candida]
MQVSCQDGFRNGNILQRSLGCVQLHDKIPRLVLRVGEDDVLLGDDSSFRSGRGETMHSSVTWKHSARRLSGRMGTSGRNKFHSEDIARAIRRLHVVFNDSILRLLSWRSAYLSVGDDASLGDPRGKAG